jgi:hypothetical protein
MNVHTRAILVGLVCLTLLIGGVTGGVSGMQTGDTTSQQNDEVTLLVDAGPDQTTIEDARTTLSAANTTLTGDASSSPIVFEWEQLAGPAVDLRYPRGTSAQIEPFVDERLFFAPDVTEPVTLRFRLTASYEDSDVQLTATDTVNVTVEPDPSEAGATASVTFDDQLTDQGVVVFVDSVTLSEGGFIAIYDDEPTAGYENVIGVSDYLPAGTSTNVRVELYDDTALNPEGVGGIQVGDSLTENKTLTAVAHYDDNGDEQFDFVWLRGAIDDPYLGPDSSPVADDAFVRNFALRPIADIEFKDQESDGSTVVVDSVTLSDGGFVVVHGEGLAVGETVESVVGVSSYLDPGTYENLEIELFDVPGASFGDGRLTGETNVTAMPHLDTDDDEQFDYVTDSGETDIPYRDLNPVGDDDPPVTSRALVIVDSTLVFYQVDFIAGDAYQQLGPVADNGFYADEDRLFRFAHGDSRDGVTVTGLAWANSTLRGCVETRKIRETDEGRASVTFTVADDCEDRRFSLAVYEKPRDSFNRSMNQTLVAVETDVFGPGTHTLTVELPVSDGSAE